MLDNGDSTLIVSPYGKTILIDGGESEKNILIPYLLARKIKKIDYLVISHFDSDHVGGLLEVMEHLKVKNVVISKQIEYTENYEIFKKIAKEKRMKVLIVRQKNKMRIEKNLYIDILWPNQSDIISENVLNNNSIVCKLNYEKFSILFTGDIEETAEKQILEYYKNNFKMLNSTMLKVAHHGSKTSTTQEFLNAVNPQFALIGVGKNNTFGHPSNEVIERLKKHNTKIYRTDEMGEIRFTINKKMQIFMSKQLY